VLRFHWRRRHGHDDVEIGCGDGWLALLFELHGRIVALAPEYELDEVFQKYGTLVVRVGNVGAARVGAVEDCLAQARERSQQVCEQCGAAGQLCRDAGGWVEVACPAHAEAGGLVPCPGMTYAESGVRSE